MSSKDLGAPEKKRRSRPVEPMEPIGCQSGDKENRHLYQDENGKFHKGNEVRQVCPSMDYRHLLSPETRARLEEVSGS